MTLTPFIGRHSIRMHMFADRLPTYVLDRGAVNRPASAHETTSIRGTWKIMRTFNGNLSGIVDIWKLSQLRNLFFSAVFQ